MADQVRLLNVTSIAMIAVSSMVLLVSVILISMIDGPVTDFDTVVTFVRFVALALMCISAALSALAVGKSLESSGMSTLMWRRIREASDDDAAYEQRASVERLNRLLYTGRNDLRMGAIMLALGSILMAATYLLEMLVSMGYL